MMDGDVDKAHVTPVDNEWCYLEAYKEYSQMKGVFMWEYNQY